MTRPDPIRACEPNTWANDTMSRRKPATARRTLDENAFAPEVAARIEALAAEMPDAPIRQLHEPQAPDAAAWAAAIEPRLGRDWLHVEWFFAETYFYRRLLEAIGYFDGNPIDPFAYQKRQGLATTAEPTAALARQLNGWIGEPVSAETLSQLIAIDLWGNRADLSLWPADEQQHGGEDLDAARDFLLADDSAEVADLLLQTRGGRVDFLVDNAGFELVGDLALADYLLATGVVDTVQLNIKLHPTFVSDATRMDVAVTAETLSLSEDAATRAFGQRIGNYLNLGRVTTVADPFWVSPYPGSQLPASTAADLAQSRLIISKGDANYRRLLGDAHWPYTTPFAEIVDYMPAPLLALRTLKSELATGLTPEKIEQLNATDDEWLVSGRYGGIQRVD